MQHFKMVNGVEVELTPEEIAEYEAKQAVPPESPSLQEQLNALFETLPPETQADLSPLAAAVKMHLDAGKPDIAKLIIERAQIPAELEPLRALMLEKFK